MKQLRILCLFFVLSNCTVLMSKNKTLHFNTQGNFKIVQFTDSHISCKTEGTFSTLDMIKEVLDAEKPDLIMLTGDIVVQNNPGEKWDLLAAIFAERNIPWAVVLGNHDDEYDTKRVAFADIFKNYPGCINKKVRKVDGVTNFVLQIQNSENETGALLYGFDSHAYSRIPSVKGYDWFQPSQLEWYRHQSARYTKKNNGKPLPALAFFHIPLPEYNDVIKSEKNIVVGMKKEKVCNGAVNAGMFAEMLKNGDVMGTFVGHDHDNDYIGVLNGIALAYGRFSNSTGCPYGSVAPGARVILLKENKRSFESWIRVQGGEVVDTCTYPDSFVLQTPQVR